MENTKMEGGKKMNFLKIAGSDIKGIFKNRFIRVSVIAIIVVPLLYSLLYLDAFWDPYSKLADMPVAVVNLDQGTNLDGKYESYGQDFVDKLKDDDRVGWRFVSESDANEGLEGNKYYAKLVITEDFSKDIVSAKEGAPKQANLKFVCNEKKNYLASQVNSKVETALQAEITKTVTDTYVTGAFDNLYKVKDGMDAAADGSGQLNDGLTTLNDKIPTLEDGANKLNDGSNQLYTGQVQLNDGISQLNGGLATLNSGVSEFAGVSKLDDGIKQIGGGLYLVNNGSNELSNGLGALNSNMPTLSSGVSDLSRGTNDLNTGINKLYTGYTNQIYPGVRALDDGLKQIQAKLAQAAPSLTKLNDGSKSIQNASTKVTDASGKIKYGYANVKGGVDKLIEGSTNSAQALALAEQYLTQGKTNEGLAIIKQVNQANAASANDVAKLKQGASDLSIGIDQYNGKISEYTTGVNTLANGTSTLISSVSAINAGVTQLSNGSGTLKLGLDTSFGPGLKKINEGTGIINEGLASLDSKVPEVSGGISKLYNGSTSISAATNKLYQGSIPEAAGISKLNSKVPDLMTGVPKLYSGSNDALAGSNKLVKGQGDLKDGIGTLSSQVPTLKDGVTKLHDGSNELATKLKDGSGELSDGLVNTSQDMGTFVSSPVNLEVAPINPVPNYGTGFAPYFSNLSLWIGAIMMFFVISARTEQYEGATKFDKAFGKFLSFGFVGILQAILVGIVVLALGLAPGNVPLYFASLIFFSLVYISIVQCLISLFGDAGRLLSIVLLIFQLTACAGTFPLELVPKIFVVLNPFMPFTYSVEALREISSAAVINYGVIGKDFIVLAIVMIVFLAISIAGATFGEKMQRIIEGRKEGTN
jgi:putative membrane protein